MAERFPNSHVFNTNVWVTEWGSVHWPVCLHAVVFVSLPVWRNPPSVHCVYPTFPNVAIHFQMGGDPSIYLNIRLSIYLPIHLSIHLSIHPSVHPSIHLFVYLPIHLSIYLSIHPSIYITLIDTDTVPLTHMLVMMLCCCVMLHPYTCLQKNGALSSILLFNSALTWIMARLLLFRSWWFLAYLHSIYSLLLRRVSPHLCRQHVSFLCLGSGIVFFVW